MDLLNHLMLHDPTDVKSKVLITAGSFQFNARLPLVKIVWGSYANQGLHNNTMYNAVLVVMLKLKPPRFAMHQKACEIIFHPSPSCWREQHGIISWS